MASINVVQFAKIFKVDFCNKIQLLWMKEFSINETMVENTN